MKNKYAVVSVGMVLILAALGCGISNPFGKGGSDSGNTDAGQREKTFTDKAVDITVGESKIGIPECDDAMNAVTAEMNNSDDDFITKAAKATFLNRLKDAIRESVEKNKTNPKELAKTCREFKKQFDKFKAEEEQRKRKKQP